MTDSLKAILNVINASGDGKKDKETVEPKDFVWDQFVSYISSAILALTIFDISVEFFRDGGVACFHPADTVSLLPSKPGMDAIAIYEFARDQAMFINKYCFSSIPITEYFPIYILVHGLLLLTPHYVWGAVFRGDFDSFFSIISKIDRLRSSKTGEYSEENFDRVKKLEKEYGNENQRIFISYIGKLLIQLMVCGVSIGVSAGVLMDFSFAFHCPRSLEEDGIIPDGWPLNVTVPCVYTTLRILEISRIADFILTCLAAILILYGLFWCVIRHTEQLGCQQIAKFAFQSCLKPEVFSFPPVIRFSGRKYLKLLQEDYEMNGCIKYMLWLLTHRVHSFSVSNCFTPRILNDLDFLLMRLFRADASHGKVFKNIQVKKELKQLVGRDHQMLHLYLNIQNDMAYYSQDNNGIDAPSLEEETQEEVKVKNCWSVICCCFKRKKRVVQESLEEEDSQIRARGHGDLEECQMAPSNSERDGESLRRRRSTATHRGNNVAVNVGGQSSDTDGCWTHLCARVILSLCCCAFKKKIKDRRLRDDITNEQPISRMYRDFRDIFANSEFNDNPERIAYVYFKPHLGNLDLYEENLRGMRDMIYLFICKYGKARVPSNDHMTYDHCGVALDLSFGTIGYALILARAFKKVYSINFHPFYRNEEDVVKEEEFYTNYYILTYPDDIYTRINHHINQANVKILGHLRADKESHRRLTVDMILVGPVADEPNKVSINLLLNSVQEKYISDGALLLAVRPLRIGSEKISSYKFEPSKKLFKRISEEKLTPKQQLELCRYVDGQKGYKVVCGGVSCIFEFEAYRFIGGGLHEDDSKDGDGGGLVVTTEDNPGCHGDGIGGGGDSSERTGEFAVDMENDCGTSHGSPDSGLFSPTIQNNDLPSDPACAASSMSNVDAATTETLPSDDILYGTPPSEREDEEIISEPDQESPLSAGTSSAASRIRLREKNVTPDMSLSRDQEPDNSRTVFQHSTQV